MSRHNFILAISVLLTACFFSNISRADLIVNFDNVGGGVTAGSIHGTLNVLLSNSSGTTTIGTDRVFGESLILGDEISWVRVPPSDGRQSSWLWYDSTFSSGRLFTGTPLPRQETGFKINGVALLLRAGRSARFATFDLGDGTPQSKTFDESFLLNYDASNLRTGTWTWGTPGGAKGDGITLNINSAVPEPTGIALGGLFLFGVLRFRARKDLREV